ncbi:glycosyltransferase family 4 protein [Bellilinea sp.]|uniref:glycosyltransferase family 4 protein n=1 Tax=Bellilinea sp. TaxID=2838785 RepID=UPI002ADE40D6|nr:glycosyltransferase family 4 protein [Bellilinea sp.]
MHLLLIHQAFASLDEAGGTRHYEMARFLVSRGHRVTIVASPVSYLTGKSQTDKVQWLEREQPEEGITILRVFTYPALHKSFFHRLVSFFSFMISSFLVGLSVKQVDLVWGTSPPIFQGVTAWLIARIKGVRFLFEVRDLWPAFAIAAGVLRNPLLIWLSEGLERFLYRHADRVMVNSPGFIEHVSRNGARWVELVPNGADPSMFDPHQNGSRTRQQWGLEGEFVVLYAGAHGLSNDLEVVLQSANILRDEPHIRFVLVGDGKEKFRLIRQAEEMGLTNVIFMPPVAKKEMSEILSAADACLAILKPLEWYKTTYPNKVFDYMAAAKPVVLAIDGVIREVVETHNAGIAVPPGDPQALAQVIRSLAADPQKTREMGLAGRRAVENCYNRRQFSIRLAEIIEEMRF